MGLVRPPQVAIEGDNGQTCHSGPHRANKAQKFRSTAQYFQEQPPVVYHLSRQSAAMLVIDAEFAEKTVKSE